MTIFLTWLKNITTEFPVLFPCFLLGEKAADSYFLLINMIYLGLGIGHEGVSKFEVPTALSAGHVLLFINTTGSNMALVR